MAAIFDPAPVLDRFHGATANTIATALGVTPRTVARWRTGNARLTLPQADRMALAVDRHPCELWPDQWGATA